MLKIGGKFVERASQYDPIAHAEEMRQQADRIQQIKDVPPKGAKTYMRQAQRDYRKLQREGR